MGAPLPTESRSRYVSPRLIGRRAEQARLGERLAESRLGAGQTVLVEGEAGIGKSRLVDEVTRSARARGHRVLVGGCVSLEDGAAPLAPIAEAMRGLAAEIPGVELDALVGPARVVLSGLFPGLLDARQGDARPGLMQASSQDRLYAHLVDLMARLSRQAPLVLVVEDIHWADAATLELLNLLVRNLRSAPFVLIATFRTDEAGPNRRLTAFVAELERLTRPERIRLTRFSRGEITEHVAAIRGAAKTDARLIEDVVARSDGNPFFVEELLAAPNADPSGLPSTLDEVLATRLGALSESARQIVAASAVRGNDSTEEELAAVTQLDGDTLAAAIHELLDRKIIARRRSGDREVLAFRHTLLRSAAYRDLLPGERGRLHAAFASYLERDIAKSSDPYHLAELALHLEAAGEATRALSAALSAGAAAEAAYQPALANDQYERAIRLLDRAATGGPGQTPDRIDVFERAARASAGIGSPRSIDHIAAALELVDATLEPVRAGLLYERMGRYRWYLVDGEGALAAYRQAVLLVPVEPPSSARARVTAGIAQLLMILARFEESMAYCHESMANAHVVGDRAVEAHAADTLGVNVAYLGEPEKGLELIWSANAIAEAEGDVEEVARTYANLVDVLLTAGRYEQAAELGRQSFAYCAEHGLAAVYGGELLNYAAWALHILGRWPEASAALDEARTYRLDKNSEIMNLAVMAMMEACRGDVELAQAHLELAGPLIATAIDTQLILPYAEARAELALATGQPDEALRAVGEGIARSEPLVGGNIKRYGPVYALGVRAAADSIAQPTLDAAQGAKLREQAGKLMSAMVEAHRDLKAHHSAHLRLAEPYLALCRAEWTRIEGAPDPNAWLTAAELLAQLGRRYLAAYARYRQAQAELGLRGRTEAADAALASAHAAAVEMGAHVLRDSIEKLGRRGRIPLSIVKRHGDAQPVQFGLTDREVDVLQLLAVGKTNKQIGEELFISGKTVSVHVSNILAKLGVSRRSEAAAIAARIGLPLDGSTAAEHRS